MEANRWAHARRQCKSHRGCCRMHPQKTLNATAAAGSRATDTTELANAFVGQRGTAEFGHVASGLLPGFRPLTVASWYKFQQSSRPSPLPFARLCIRLSQVLRTPSETLCLPTQFCSSSPPFSASAQQDSLQPQQPSVVTDCLVFLQATANRPTTESVVDESGHVVGKLFLKEGRANTFTRMDE